MFGYEPNSKAYRVLLDTGKISISRDVIFDEAFTQERGKQDEEEQQVDPAANTEVIQAVTQGIDYGPTYSTDSSAEEEPPQETQPTAEQTAASLSITEASSPEPEQPRYPIRQRKAPTQIYKAQAAKEHSIY